ncbi:MAG: DNA mismatch repair endonuclease MutL [Prevotellaceae bacterium]|jgi:DNA mismatch repair protein MutL|nr:DNA mismatch repair endonuclease MutL [Prevotellaceae bacterium]
MSDIIHLLPDAVANQIAAGEVIQRPASVVKELVENAIDAGADTIRIIIKDAGRTLIQVIDNGKGMSETDALRAFERHATSKISSADDLFALRTMGFRGEALASIAAIAHVELRTKQADSELGTLIEIAGTQINRQETIQTADGSSFSVKNLFFNVPARRRFLKNDAIEKRHLLQEFYRIVLVNPTITFSLIDGNEETFHLPETTLKLRIEHVFGKKSKKRWEQQLLAIETKTTIGEIYGYIGRPEFAQKSACQYFFVNGRYMQHAYFHKAVMTAYEQLIPQSDKPNYFIYFRVDPESIDINIHPTKTEIKFEHGQAFWSILQATVKEALGKFNVAPAIDFNTEGAVDMPIIRPNQEIRPPKTAIDPTYNPFQAAGHQKQQFDWEKLYQGFENEHPGQAEDQNDAVQLFHTTSENQPVPHSVDNFQLRRQYILTGIKSGLLIIDQQRAHYRILFDRFLLQLEQKKAFSQQVIFPDKITLSIEDKAVFDQLEESLRFTGFDFETDKEDPASFYIKGIPPQLNPDVCESMLKEMIHRTKESQTDNSRQVHILIAKSLAKAASLKNGQHLSNEEMTDLIDKLFSLPEHNYTPEGKRIFTTIIYEDIEKAFL